MRLRQVKQLLYTVAQADPQPFAAPEGNQRLRQLKTRVVRVGPGIRVGREPLDAVRFADDQDQQCTERTQQHQHEVTQLYPRQKQHAESGTGHDDRGTEVRLYHQQQGGGKQHRHGFQESLPFMSNLMFPSPHVTGQVHHDGQLGKPRGLQGEGSQRKPALAAIDLPTDPRNQHENQQRQRHEQPDPAGLQPERRWQAVNDNRPGQGQQQVDQVPLGVEPGILVVPVRIFYGGGTDRHESHQQQGKAEQCQRRIRQRHGVIRASASHAPPPSGLPPPRGMPRHAPRSC